MIVMMVRCIENTNANIAEELLDPAGGLHRHTRYDLTVGTDYVVYALAVRNGFGWYYLNGDDHPYYPVRYPAHLFSVQDGGLSSRWRYAYSPSHRDHPILLAFAAWVTDPLFYDRLTDMEDAAMQVFREEKARMDAEHAARAQEPG